MRLPTGGGWQVLRTERPRPSRWTWAWFAFLIAWSLLNFVGAIWASVDGLEGVVPGLRAAACIVYAWWAIDLYFRRLQK